MFFNNVKYIAGVWFGILQGISAIAVISNVSIL
jgi:hypothetical protein